MNRMAGPHRAVMCNLVNTHTQQLLISIDTYSVLRIIIFTQHRRMFDCEMWPRRKISAARVAAL